MLWVWVYMSEKKLLMAEEKFLSDPNIFCDFFMSTLRRTASSKISL